MMVVVIVVHRRRWEGGECGGGSLTQGTYVVRKTYIKKQMKYLPSLATLLQYWLALQPYLQRPQSGLTFCAVAVAVHNAQQCHLTAVWLSLAYPCGSTIPLTNASGDST